MQCLPGLSKTISGFLVAVALASATPGLGQVKKHAKRGANAPCGPVVYKTDRDPRLDLRLFAANKSPAAEPGTATVYVSSRGDASRVQVLVDGRKWGSIGGLSAISPTVYQRLNLPPGGHVLTAIDTQMGDSRHPTEAMQSIDVKAGENYFFDVDYFGRIHSQFEFRPEEDRDGVKKLSHSMRAETYAERQERLRSLVEGWPKLQKGMDANEVESLVGALPADAVILIGVLKGDCGTFTIKRAGEFELVFGGEGLNSWRLDPEADLGLDGFQAQ